MFDLPGWAAINPPDSPNPLTLDFCFWIQTNIDAIIGELNDPDPSAAETFAAYV